LKGERVSRLNHLGSANTELRRRFPTGSGCPQERCLR
jgi:hypothetical protein